MVTRNPPTSQKKPFLRRPSVILRPRQLPMSPMPRAGPEMEEMEHKWQTI